jgi:thiol-disulfide isomerase/thioredoxin
MTNPPRRRWLVSAGVAAAGVAGGAAAYWWQRRAPHDPAVEAFWALELDTPTQTRLAMTTLRGQPLVLNFWATWCPPCVREMPALDRFYRDHRGRGWQVLGLAADNAAAVRDFLARAPVAFPVVMAGFEGIDLSRRLGNLSGGLPFSVVFGRDGGVRHRHVGETTYEQLAGWAQGLS